MIETIILVRISKELYISSGSVWNVANKNEVRGTGWYVSGMLGNSGPHKTPIGAAKYIAKRENKLVSLAEPKGDNRSTCPFCGSSMEHKSTAIDGVCWAFMKCTNYRQGCLHETNAQLVSTPVHNYRDQRHRDPYFRYR